MTEITDVYEDYIKGYEVSCERMTLALSIATRMCGCGYKCPAWVKEYNKKFQTLQKECDKYDKSLHAGELWEPEPLIKIHKRVWKFYAEIDPLLQDMAKENLAHAQKKYADCVMSG